jgi:WD40 repeat protein
MSRKTTSGDVSRMALSPDGRLLAVGGFGGALQIWDAATFQPVRKLAGHKQAVAGMSFSPDSRLLATGSFDQTIKLWQVAHVGLVRCSAICSRSVFGF